MSINNPFHTDTTSTSQTELYESRQKLKKIIWESIAELPTSRAKILLADMGAVERFLLDGKNKKNLPITKNVRSFRYMNDSNTAIFPLQEVVGGIVNRMTLPKIKEILENPEEMVSVLQGKPYLAKKNLDTKDDFIIERIATIDQIKENIRDMWQTLDWGNKDSTKPSAAVLEKVSQAFRKKGLIVKVDFAYPDDPEHGGDYIVIAENKRSRARGVLIPRHGIVLDFPFNSGCFMKPGPNMMFPVTEISEFPEIEKDFTENSTKPKWKITKIGKIKIPEVV